MPSVSDILFGWSRGGYRNSNPGGGGPLQESSPDRRSTNGAPREVDPLASSDGTDVKWWIGLLKVPGIGARTATRLAASLGGPEAAYRSSRSRFLSVEGASERLWANLERTRSSVDLDREEDRARRACDGVLAITDPGYPPLLGQIHDPPPILFYRGDPAVASAPAVAVVGTRRSSPYGERMARAFARDLAARGIAVVSGLARGIDSAAHRGALEAGGATTAVLGCGVDVIYPAVNAPLQREIADKGVVLSEFLPGVRPLAGHFPARNRIISGLSLGVVVIEAGRRSGALVTARCALEQGREVMCVPGPVSGGRFAGSHALVRDGACLVEDAGDVVEAIGSLPLAGSPAGASADGADAGPAGDSTGSTPDEREVLALMSDAPVGRDEIVRLTGLDPARVTAALLTLELRGLCRSLADATYVRTRGGGGA